MQGTKYQLGDEAWIIWALGCKEGMVDTAMPCKIALVRKIEEEQDRADIREITKKVEYCVVFQVIDGYYLYAKRSEDCVYRTEQDALDCIEILKVIMGKAK